MNIKDKSKQTKDTTKYLCSDICLAYDKNGIIGAFVINESENAIKDLASGEIVDIPDSYLDKNQIHSQEDYDYLDELAKELGVESIYELSEAINFIVALNLLYPSNNTNKPKKIEDLNADNFRKLQYDSLSELTYKYTFGTNIPGHTFAKVRKEMFKSYFNILSDKSYVLHYFNKTIVTFEDLIPLLREIDKNIKLNKTYQSKKEKKEAKKKDEISQQEAAHNNIKF